MEYSTPRVIESFPTQFTSIFLILTIMAILLYISGHTTKQDLDDLRILNISTFSSGKHKIDVNMVIYCNLFTSRFAVTFC
jgi:hypothetical protein